MKLHQSGDGVVELSFEDPDGEDVTETVSGYVTGGMDGTIIIDIGTDHSVNSEERWGR